MSRRRFSCLSESSSASSLPHLVLFSQGYPHHIESLRLSLLQRNSEKNTDSVLRGCADGILFEAKPAKMQKKFCVGVVDGEEIGMMEAGLFQCRATLQGVAPPPDFAAVLGVQETDEKDHMNERRLVFDAFGAKKKQRQLKSKDANRIKGTDGMKLALEMATAGSIETSNPSDPMANGSQSLLPKFNSVTENVDDIYPLENVFPKDLWESVDYKEFLRSISQDHSSVNEYILSLAGSIGVCWRNLIPSQQQIRGVALMLLCTLLHFCRSPRKMTSSEGLLKYMPMVIADHWISLFTKKLGDTYSRETEESNKLKLYICVLSLIASDFAITATQIGLLCKEMGIVLTSCLEFFKQTGSTYKKKADGDEVMVTLKAPVKFPKLAYSKKK